MSFFSNLHKNTHPRYNKKKEVGSLFRRLKNKEPHNLRRGKSDELRGRSLKAGREAYEAVTFICPSRLVNQDNLRSHFNYNRKTCSSLSPNITFCITSSLTRQTKNKKPHKNRHTDTHIGSVVAWHIHSSPLLECVRPGSLSVPELQRQRLSPLIDHAFVLSAPLLRNAR